MTTELEAANMYRVAKVWVQPVGDEVPVEQSVTELQRRGFDVRQVDQDEFDRQVQQWRQAEQWSVSWTTKIMHGDPDGARVDEPRLLADGGRAVTRVVTAQWYNASMDTVECPQCGVELTRFALHGHEGSKRCQAMQNRNEVEERGLERVRSKSPAFRALISEFSDVGIVSLGTTYVCGDQNTRSKLQEIDYAPAEAIQQARTVFLPAPVKKVESGSVTRGEIMWRSDEYCVARTPDAMHVVVVEDPDRLARRRSVYFQSVGDERIAFNSDGRRIGVSVPEYAGEVWAQQWNRENAVIKLTTHVDVDARVVLPHPVDIASPVTNPRCSEESAADEESEMNRVPPVPESITAGFVPESVLVVDNGVVVELP